MLQMWLVMQSEAYERIQSNCNKIGHFAKVCQQAHVYCVNNSEEQEDIKSGRGGNYNLPTK